MTSSRLSLTFNSDLCRQDKPALSGYCVDGRCSTRNAASYGAGAGQDVEDAYLLSQLLGHPQTTASNIESVSAVYDHVYRPRAQMVWDRSIIAG
ncbi:hypothetical protein AcW1_001240 [Taiwanofungus camphoratus]|nr:hypothetical protein AcW1_001240 [Antrodia cinnamomea]